MIEEVLVGVEFVFQESAAEFFLYEPFALSCLLPLGKSHLFHDLVDVSNDALDDDMGILTFGFFE